MARGNSKSHANSWIGYCRLSRTMITGYKKKRLGKPSEKLSGDTPRATWRAVLFSEIFFPIFMAVLFTIAYLFVKSFPVDGKFPPSPLIRIAVISLGPIVWNAAILVTQFLISLFIGPIFPNNSKFGSVMAAIVHGLAVLGIVGAFEFLVRCVHLFFTLSLLLKPSLTVVPRTMGCVSCGHWPHCRDCDPKGHSQGLEIGRAHV